MLNQDLITQKTRMDKQEIAKFYWNLPNGAKGRFVAVCTLEMGGSPSSWVNIWMQIMGAKLIKLFEKIGDVRAVIYKKKSVNALLCGVYRV